MKWKIHSNNCMYYLYRRSVFKKKKIIIRTFLHLYDKNKIITTIRNTKNTFDYNPMEISTLCKCFFFFLNVVSNKLKIKTKNTLAENAAGEYVRGCRLWPQYVLYPTMTFGNYIFAFKGCNKSLQFDLSSKLK